MSDGILFAGILARDVPIRVLWAALHAGDTLLLNDFLVIGKPNEEDKKKIEEALTQFDEFLDAKRTNRPVRGTADYWKKWDELFNNGCAPRNAKQAREINILFRTTLPSNALSKYELDDVVQRPITYNLPIEGQVPEEYKFSSESGSDAANKRWEPFDEPKRQFGTGFERYFVDERNKGEFDSIPGYDKILRQYVEYCIGADQLPTKRTGVNDLAAMYCDELSLTPPLSWGQMKDAAKEVLASPAINGQKFIDAARVNKK